MAVCVVTSPSVGGLPMPTFTETLTLASAADSTPVLSGSGAMSVTASSADSSITFGESVQAEKIAVQTASGGRQRPAPKSAKGQERNKGGSRPDQQRNDKTLPDTSPLKTKKPKVDFLNTVAEATAKAQKQQLAREKRMVLKYSADGLFQDGFLCDLCEADMDFRDVWNEEVEKKLDYDETTTYAGVQCTGPCQRRMHVGCVKYGPPHLRTATENAQQDSKTSDRRSAEASAAASSSKKKGKADPEETESDVDGSEDDLPDDLYFIMEDDDGTCHVKGEVHWKRALAKTFVCDACKTSRHECFLCKEVGDVGMLADGDDAADNVVQMCTVGDCRKFFHLKCLKEEDEDFVVPSGGFKCPRHNCSACGNGQRMGKALMCIRCPASYHPGNCCPSDALMLKERHFICESHFPFPSTYGFKYVDPSTGLTKREPIVGANVLVFGADSEALPGGKVMFRRPPMSDFKLPRAELLSGQKLLHSQPAPYKKVSMNFYARGRPKPPKLDDVVQCHCQGEPRCATMDCVNRATLYECDKRVCHAECQNQRLQRRQYVKTTVKRTDDRGFGLFLLEDAKAGDLIVEYCGDVVSDAECNDRLSALRKKGETNFYMFKVNGAMVIDAGPTGNYARFANHSCDPNCATQKWTVGNEIRVGIFALNNIPAGTEVTYNYNFEGYWSADQAQACHCGASNCSGTLGKKPLKKMLENLVKKKVTKKRSKPTKAKTPAKSPKAADPPESNNFTEEKAGGEDQQPKRKKTKQELPLPLPPQDKIAVDVDAAADTNVNEMVVDESSDTITE